MTKREKGEAAVRTADELFEEFASQPESYRAQCHEIIRQLFGNPRGTARELAIAGRCLNAEANRESARAEERERPSDAMQQDLAQTVALVQRELECTCNEDDSVPSCPRCRIILQVRDRIEHVAAKLREPKP